ncbi:hypothetical protein CLOM_g16925 [Closterium sp. NIES-68]|nr:hypothetical protein CLOM_g16925 [Closterium sp. NIES-68]
MRVFCFEATTCDSPRAEVVADVFDWPSFDDPFSVTWPEMITPEHAMLPRGMAGVTTLDGATTAAGQCESSADVGFEISRAASVTSLRFCSDGRIVQCGNDDSDLTPSRKIRAIIIAETAAGAVSVDGNPRGSGSVHEMMLGRALVSPLPVAMMDGGFYKRYAVREVLGVGNYGVVRRCWDMKSGVEFACKSLAKSKALRCSSGWLNRSRCVMRRQAEGVSGVWKWHTEVAALLRLRGHPNIVQLYGVCDDAHSLHLLLELCSGGELHAALRRYASEGSAAVTGGTNYSRKGMERRDLFPDAISLSDEYDDVMEDEEVTENLKALPEAVALGIFQQLLSAVHSCHACGVVHCDIKLENVLVSQSGASSDPGCITGLWLGKLAPLVKLCDFGSALCLDQAQPSSSLMGFRKVGCYREATSLRSMYFQAPEVIRGGTAACSKQSDMWSIGVILHVLLTGRLPFVADSTSLLWRRIRRGHVDYSELCWEGVSPKAMKLVQRLLVVDPAARATTSELMHALRID